MMSDFINSILICASLGCVKMMLFYFSICWSISIPHLFPHSQQPFPQIVSCATPEKCFRIARSFGLVAKIASHAEGLARLQQPFWWVTDLRRKGVALLEIFPTSINVSLSFLYYWKWNLSMVPNVCL